MHLHLAYRWPSLGCQRPEPDNLYDLSLEELLSVPVTSVSRRDQTLAQTPAAVYVITADEIARSPANSIPELLRTVPGMHVASIDANKWAVSARGLNGRYANKLLVLQDGRSLYAPLFSGVYWDSVDLVLEDIERIEVIRGPGAALWGANAVNGVINIITKDARDTQEGMAKAQTGTDMSRISLRNGWRIGEAGAARIYAQSSRYDDTMRVDGSSTHDAWTTSRAGARVDWILDVDSDATLTAEAYSTDADETTRLALITPPYSIERVGSADINGGSVMGRYRHAVSPRSEVTVASYIEYYERSTQLYDEKRWIFDIDYQQSLDDVAFGNWLWGLNFRRTEDDLWLDLITTGVGTATPSRADNLYGGFVQGQFDLGTENWELTIGSKFEQNDYTGFEVQPNLRVLWSPEPRLSVWASIARAVRTPSRGESDLTTIFADGVIPPLSGPNQLPVPLAFGVIGTNALEAEDLTAYEFGVRRRFEPGIVADVAVFHNDYDDLRGIGMAPPICEPSGELLYASPACVLDAEYVLAGGVIENRAGGSLSGAELALDWQFGPTRLHASYSYLTSNILDRTDGAASVNYSQTTPRHLLSVGGTHAFSPNSAVDATIRYSDKICLPTSGPTGFVTRLIEDHVSVDVQWRWRVTPQLELSLRGTNIFDDRRIEFLSEAGEVPSGLVERAVSAHVRYDF